MGRVWGESHARGNSKGGLAAYWATIEARPGRQGGFLWEWKDHGLRQRLPDGTTRLAYGGQLGERVDFEVCSAALVGDVAPRAAPDKDGA